MALEQLVKKYECGYIKHPDKAVMAERIMNAFEHYEQNKDVDHNKCPDTCEWKMGSHELICLYSCPWKLREYIECLPDPKFLIQDLVKEGDLTIKKDLLDEAEKSVHEAKNNLQNLINSHANSPASEKNSNLKASRKASDTQQLNTKRSSLKMDIDTPTTHKKNI